MAKLALQMSGENDGFLNMKRAGIIHKEKIKEIRSLSHPVCVYIFLYVYTITVTLGTCKKYVKGNSLKICEGKYW